MNCTRSNFACYRGELAVRGVEYRPQGENLPIAIVCHGFMADHTAILHYAELFAENGYATYALDFCGGSARQNLSDGQTQDMSVLTEVEDLKAVVRYVAALPYTDASSVTLMGCSQGGFVCALAAAELQSAVSKLVLFYPAFCIPDDARSGHMVHAQFDPQDPPALIPCGPMTLGRSYVTAVNRMDPYAIIADYPGDILMVHGTADSLVDVSYADRAEAVYAGRTAGSITYKTIEGGVHVFSPEHDRIAMDHIRAFIKA